MRSGIYQIIHLPSGDSYVGASTDLDYRMGSHISQIKNKSHPNILIRQASKECEASDFQVKVLEECPVCDLGDRERHWIEDIMPFFNHRKKFLHPSIRKFETSIRASIPVSLKKLIDRYRQQQKIVPQESEVIRDLLKRGLKDVGLL